MDLSSSRAAMVSSWENSFVEPRDGWMDDANSMTSAKVSVRRSSDNLASTHSDPPVLRSPVSPAMGADFQGADEISTERRRSRAVRCLLPKAPFQECFGFPSQGRRGSSLSCRRGAWRRATSCLDGGGRISGLQLLRRRRRGRFLGRTFQVSAERRTGRHVANRSRRHARRPRLRCGSDLQSHIFAEEACSTSNC